MTTHVVLSGGMDSTVALAYALSLTPPGGVAAVSFHYGQRHRQELVAAARIARHYGVPHRVLDLTGMLGGSALIDRDVPVPHGHYAADNMAVTVVPGRNLLFASVAVAGASAGDVVMLGVHAGDHDVYPDCRPEFWQPFRTAVLAAYSVAVHTPFIESSKAAIVGMGWDLGAPLGWSWSCYEGTGEHCGRCGTCVERAEAFHAAGVIDPTVYTDPWFWRTVTA